MTLMPNPVGKGGDVKLWIRGYTGVGSFRLINGYGQIMQQWRQANISNTAIPIYTTTLPACVYVLQAEFAAGILVQKLVIQ